MRFSVHINADKDLDKLSEIDEDAVGYIDYVINLISEKSLLIEDLFRDPYFRDYQPPTGKYLGLEVKKIVTLYRQGYDIRRMKFDDERVKDYRVIFAVISTKKPNGTYENEIKILSVVHKEKDAFNYQDNHDITVRMKKDYAD